MLSGLIKIYGGLMKNLVLLAGAIFTITACQNDVERYGVNLDRTELLRGVDADGNGLRDDIDEYIHLHYKSKATINAAKLLVMSIQNALTVDKEDSVAVKNVAKQFSHASNCVFLAFPDGKSENGASIALTLQNLVVNTTQRRHEYTNYSNALIGYVTPIDRTTSCTK